MSGVKWGYFLDLNTLHEFGVMMLAISGFIFGMAPTAITLKFFSLSAIKAVIRKYSKFFVQGPV
jgi:hypothetical protein